MPFTPYISYADNVLKIPKGLKYIDMTHLFTSAF